MRSRSKRGSATVALIMVLAALVWDRVTVVKAGRLVERTVAFVNKRPVLLSDVELTKALLKIQESEAIERAIEEALMFDEASRLTSAAQVEEEIAAAVAVLEEKAGPGFTKAQLRRQALTQLAIATYIELRLRPLVRIEDGEIRRAFSERVAQDPSAPPLGQVADSIREVLERRALDQQIEEWVASLRKRNTVRRVPAFVPSPLAPAKTQPE